MNPATITGSTFTLTPQGGSAVAATVSYDISNLTATLTPNFAAGLQHDLHGDDYNGSYVVPKPKQHSAGRQLHMDVHDRDSAAAVGDCGDASKFEYNSGHHNHCDSNVQSGDEFVDDHCFDLHADRAGKHYLCKVQSATTPELRLRRLLRRRIWLTTLHTQRRLARAL